MLIKQWTGMHTGRELDAASGLYYYRARYYDPELGRFISEDPIGFQGGVNFYAYVGNNPLRFNDPMGEAPGDVFDANNWNVARGKEIAAQVALSAQNLAIKESGGDRGNAKLLLHNGKADTWRHAEWQRRTASEMNPLFALAAGVQHEALGLADWAEGWWNDEHEVSFSQQVQETYMDLSNNFVGRNAAENNVSGIGYDNTLLTYGAGGINGQPDASFSSYSAVQFFLVCRLQILVYRLPLTLQEVF